jgi:NAD(P)H dehydrogenase (quinone)
VHGGNEATILAMYQTLYHWGAVVVAPGYTQPDVPAGGQSPYGTAHTSSAGAPEPDVLAAARHQGRRLATYAALVAPHRMSPP